MYMYICICMFAYMYMCISAAGQIPQGLQHRGDGLT